MNITGAITITGAVTLTRPRQHLKHPQSVQQHLLVVQLLQSHLQHQLTMAVPQLQATQLQVHPVISPVLYHKLDQVLLLLVD